MVSDDLANIVKRVSGRTTDEIDLEFVGLLAVDPEVALAQYPGLTDDERKAILLRDSEALERAGLSAQAADAVQSGAHSQRCPE